MAYSLCVVASSVSRDCLSFAKGEETLQLPLQRPGSVQQGFWLKNNSMLNVVYLHQGEKQCSDICSEALWIQANSVSSELLENATEHLPVTINHRLLILCLEMQAERILINQRRFHYSRSKFSAFKKKNLIFLC